MSQESPNIIQAAFTLLFIGTLVAGVYLFRNYDRLFAPDPDLPSETHSARSYNKLQFFVLWLHAVALTGAFALLLH